MRDDSSLIRLDAETKVALMAALIYDGNAEEAVAVALHIEQLAHERVAERFREQKRSPRLNRAPIDFSSLK